MRLRTEARRETILEVAAGVFMELGYGKASMAEIAVRAGCSKPTLYGYFPSKEELFMSVVHQRLGSEAEPIFLELPTLGDEEPGPVLTRLGECFINAITLPEAPAFKRLIMTTMTDRADAERCWELGNKQAVQIIEAYLQAATQAGRLKVKNPRVAAQQMLSLFEAEINWGGPIGFAPNLTPEMIHQASTHAVEVFLAAYGVARQIED
ncbi:TetR/AcrR family transcriptional regulator [Pseudogulbenkiania sp. MAI-1]|uniref:TetR/AcrR family transcriptional regulator n=1 Tax=Pseudogulbenkiania sp. MAI-1 TaxID=990370 RepID=UPI00045EBC0B|nr:TetR/AcrR family transcriptional regulator [Pseudogulbenkiania sp. MAI-1]